jgi:hypothetical protein
VNGTSPTGPQSRRARSAGASKKVPTLALVAAGLVGLAAVAFTGSRLTDPAAENPPSLTPTTPVGLHVEAETLADGFPTDLVPRPPESTITSSAVDPQEGVGTTISLTGESPDRVSALLSFYRIHLTKMGFSEVPGGMPEGMAGAMFTRSKGSELLTLAIMDRSSSRSFSIGGTVALPDAEQTGPSEAEDESTGGTAGEGTDAGSEPAGSPTGRTPAARDDR